LLKPQIYQTFQEKIFPELWYILDGWLSLPKSPKVLDLACGHGLYSLAMNKSGNSVTCYDPSPMGLETVKQRFKQQAAEATFIQGKLSQLPFPEESWETVVCLHALEFTKNPQKFLSEIYRTLSPNGLLILSCTNRKSLWGLQRFGGCLRYDEKRRRLRGLSLIQLLHAVNTVGFAVRSVKEYGKYLPFFPRWVHKFPVPGGHILLVQKMPARHVI
jgi:ubiquinone/menaquinone biosynthesis C-methylase UbiE